MLSRSAVASVYFFLRDFAAFAGRKGIKAALFIFLGALVEGVGIVLFIPFFSAIIDSPPELGWVSALTKVLFGAFSAESRASKLSLLVVIFAVLLIARALIITTRDVTLAQLEMGFVQQVRSRITHRLAAAEWNIISRLRHSRITHVMGADIRRLESAVHILLRAAVAAILLATQVLVAFLLAPVLAAMALALVLLGAATLMPLLRRARQYGELVTKAHLSLLNDMAQFLGGLKLAISQNLQHGFIKEFEWTLANLTDQQLRFLRQQTRSRLTATTLAGLVGALAILLGVVVLDVEPSILITLLIILGRMSGPALQVQLDAQHIAYTIPAYQTIRALEGELAAAEDKETDLESSGRTMLTGGPIVFRDVMFLHEPMESTNGGVQQVNLTIEPGSIVGIMGPSGAGKTTFADLLVGLYPPQSGEILVSGVALRGATAAAWRNSISYVAQDAFLFNDTIRRNLLWTNPEADEGALWEVLRFAGADELARREPNGIDTILGERGALLSGGERQRLGLARAMLRRPRLLVLDEATSAIDLAGERMIFERLVRITPRPTIVVIAHRLEGLGFCQRLLCFDRGVLVSDERDT